MDLTKITDRIKTELAKDNPIAEQKEILDSYFNEINAHVESFIEQKIEFVGNKIREEITKSFECYKRESDEKLRIMKEEHENSVRMQKKEIKMQWAMNIALVIFVFLKILIRG